MLQETGGFIGTDVLRIIYIDLDKVYSLLFIHLGVLVYNVLERIVVLLSMTLAISFAMIESVESIQ